MAGLFLRFPHSRATRTESSILKTPLLRSSQRMQDPCSWGADNSSLRNCHRCMWEPPLPPERLEGILVPLLLLVVVSDSSSSSSEINKIHFDQTKVLVLLKHSTWIWFALHKFALKQSDENLYLLISAHQNQKSVDGTPMCYGLEGLGFQPRRGQHFLHPSRLALGPPSLLQNESLPRQQQG
jgi:hypothetical protein